jgi:hypothetical protein
MKQLLGVLFLAALVGGFLAYVVVATVDCARRSCPDGSEPILIRSAGYRCICATPARLP